MKAAERGTRGAGTDESHWCWGRRPGRGEEGQGEEARFTTVLLCFPTPQAACRPREVAIPLQLHAE